MICDSGSLCDHSRDYNKMIWPQGYKTFFMLNSAEHEISTAHKCINDEIAQIHVD